MIPRNVLAQMATLGLSVEQAEAVADMLSAVETATASEHEKAAEEGKEKARERWRKWNAKQKTNGGKRLQTTANDSQRLTRVEDKTSNTDIEPQKKEKGAKRATRLPSDWTLPVEWRRDALDAGLSENQIDLQAATMRDWSQSAPKGAKTDWRAAWRNWCRRAASEQPRGQGPPAKPPQLADVFKFIGAHGNEPEPADDSGSVRPAISYLSAVGSGRGS